MVPYFSCKINKSQNLKLITQKNATALENLLIKIIIHRTG